MPASNKLEYHLRFERGLLLQYFSAQAGSKGLRFQELSKFLWERNAICHQTTGIDHELPLKYCIVEATVDIAKLL